MGDLVLPEVSEEEFAAARQQARPYTVIVLKAGPNFSPPGPDRDPAVGRIIYAHGKRNMALRVAGLLPIICPIADGSGVAGIGIFTATPDEVTRIYSADPAVKAGVLTFEVHATRSFPGSALPA
jgi:hypothetical protein